VKVPTGVVVISLLFFRSILAVSAVETLPVLMTLLKLPSLTSSMTAVPLAWSDEEPTWLLSRLSFPAEAASLPVKLLAPLRAIVPLPVLVKPPAPLIAPAKVMPVLFVRSNVLSALMVIGLLMVAVWV
jgi:hypothetical protein